MNIRIVWIRPGRHMGGNFKAVASRPFKPGYEDDVLAVAFGKTEEEAEQALAAKLLSLMPDESS
jgi:hypothetical protein